ncbi:YfhD family protein [Paenibacillus radicis (ex Xue et al. 2023)]|uniref:YfhD family protein n=1 Tax=Paenibacillus radicis (ex Xue et al. 2023) TaxID=2972489 RepID=A0ABT1YE33_9BACL|nr:YfhD family protein [Paenibacillus radicis (ex Xue et al. 2023)]MCR8631448.1 YfhD family protein [Paenibacillus radicis (ex Xue et al. 2023)]
MERLKRHIKRGIFSMTHKEKQHFQLKQQNVADGKNEDVDFNAEVADEDDLRAVERAKEADARQE